VRRFCGKSRLWCLVRPSCFFALFAAAIPTYAQQLTCTANVPQAVCKEFDSSFGSNSVWSRARLLNRIQVVITGPLEFKAEQERVNNDADAAAKARQTAGDLNRAGGRQVGRRVFTYELLECAGSFMITRIVISTEAVDSPSEQSTPAEISNHLMFYLAGFTQGMDQAIASSVP
jgi:hypothetical protein